MSAIDLVLRENNINTLVKKGGREESKVKDLIKSAY
jgi:hypothetical protein